jgi:hypothetical protein
MKTTILIAVALCFVLTPSVCQARLGDSYEQCIARWGRSATVDIQGIIPPESKGVSNITFKVFSKDNYQFFVGFLNGVVCYERISKYPSVKFTVDELSAILNAETAGLQWTSDPNSDPNNPLWVRTDGAWALYNVDPCFMKVVSKEYREACEAALNHQPF